MAFRPGDSIGGRYVVEDVIAAGGMGVIYAARHLVLDERVAIKCLLPELSTDAEQTARLIGEARAAARIRSEHVARIIDADRLPDGTVFLAMERLDGRDLGAMLEEQRSLPFETAIAYVLQASEALAEAHACGIIHRDLKPANLFASLRTDGSTCIKVLDFGISKVLPHEAQVRTRTGMFMGTPMYASPEQLTTPNDIDRRTDIWALGCVLYELIAGEPPFVRDTMGALVAAIVGAPIAPLSTKRAGVPPAVEAAIARCLEKDRAKRWNDVAELASALAPFSPAQAAISLTRIQALASPAAGRIAFAATESGHSPVSGQAPTVAAWNAPASSRSVSEGPRRSNAPWLVAGLLAIALTGGAIARKGAHRTTAAAPTDEAAPVVTTAATAAAATDAATAVAPLAPAVEPAPSVDAGKPLASSVSAPPRAVPAARPGARHAAPSTSPPGKSDDWKMPIKE